ncbi:MAG TPA: STAS domain-containing protein [Rubrivivax sp.]
MNENDMVVELLGTHRAAVLEGWLQEVTRGAAGTRGGSDKVTENEAQELLRAFEKGLRAGGSADNFDQPLWEDVRELLAKVSRAGASRGDSAGETSRFVMAIKRSLFDGLQRATSDPARLTAAIWAISSLVDKMAQHTVTLYQHSREQIIQRQQQDLLELSTPVVKLWDGVLAVPMIGALDSNRTQLVMESLLQRIVETGSEIAILDITGVPTVDTLVAQHLLKTVTAIRLMGADCIISGVRPQIAQTIVHLGIDLQGITTKASLADALALAMKRTGHVVTRSA